MKNQFYGAMLLVMVILGVVAYFLQPQFSFPVLMGGNAILFLLSIITFSIVSRTFNSRPQAFVQGVSSGSLIKLFVCAGGILIYALVNKPHVNKPQIFVLMGMYAVYSIVENILLSRMAKAQK
jgi:hypothetical protein